MSYSVEYNPELGRRYPATRKKRGKSAGPVMILAAIAVAMYTFVQSGLVRYLLPGDPEVTAAAFSMLVERVEAGEPVRESLLHFCEEIIVNEN